MQDAARDGIVNSFGQRTARVLFVELGEHRDRIVRMHLQLAIDLSQQPLARQGTLPKGAQGSQEFGHALVLVHPEGR